MREERRRYKNKKREVRSIYANIVTQHQQTNARAVTALEKLPILLLSMMLSGVEYHFGQLRFQLCPLPSSCQGQHCGCRVRNRGGNNQNIGVLSTLFWITDSKHSAMWATMKESNSISARFSSLVQMVFLKHVPSDWNTGFLLPLHVEAFKVPVCWFCHLHKNRWKEEMLFLNHVKFRNL